ncbi:MAG TPA: hypothetical protein VGB91_14020 [Rhizomicrobium sp.]
MSEVELPGIASAPVDDTDWEVTVRLGAVPQELAAAQATGPTYQIAGDLFLLRIRGIARFLLKGGRELTVQTEDATPLEDIAIFIIGTVFGILLHQRGQIVLHASAVRVNGKAVLFCGPSGAGKSTMAAALERQRFAFVIDDLCAVVLRDGSAPMVLPDGRQLKLWSQAIENLDMADKRRAPVRKSLEKYYVEPEKAFGEPLPLGAVYVLRQARPAHPPGVAQPNVVDSALLLRRNAYRPLLVNRMGQKADYFKAAAAIANSAGIFHLTRAADFAGIPDVISTLRAHWTKIGLLEGVEA